MLRSLATSTGFSRVLVTVAIAGHLGAAFHTSHTRHLVCPEHGELVDIPLSGSVPGLDGPRGNRWQAPRSAEVAHGHEHCLLASFGRSPNSGVAAPAFVASRKLVAIGQLAPDDLSPSNSVPLYRVAPKSSPPA